MDQCVARGKESAKSNKVSSSYQKASIKNPIVKKPRTKALTLDFFFENSRMEKSLKTQDLEDEYFH